MKEDSLLWFYSLGAALAALVLGLLLAKIWFHLF